MRTMAVLSMCLWTADCISIACSLLQGLLLIVAVIWHVNCYAPLLPILLNHCSLFDRAMHRSLFCNLNCNTPTTAFRLVKTSKRSNLNMQFQQNGFGWHGGSRKYFAGRVRAAVCRHVGPKPSNQPPGHVAPASPVFATVAVYATGVCFVFVCLFLLVAGATDLRI